jgi:hypothetical protein
MVDFPATVSICPEALKRWTDTHSDSDSEQVSIRALYRICINMYIHILYDIMYIYYIYTYIHSQQPDSEW